METNGLHPEDLVEREPITPLRQQLKATPRYASVPAPQTPIIEGGQIIAWIIRMGLSSGGITHIAEERYDCEPDEIRPADSVDNGQLLQDITVKLVNERDFLARCEAELEEKINGV